MALILNNVQSAVTYDELIVKPPAPSVGKLSFYAKNDGFLYSENSAGVESQIGASGAFPATEIVFGTGAGSISDPQFTFDPTVGVKTLTVGSLSPAGGTNGIVLNGALNATIVLQTDTGGQAVLSLSNGGSLAISADDTSQTASILAGKILTVASGNGSDMSFKAGDGVGSNGGAITVTAGNGQPIDGTTAQTGGAISLTGGNSSARVNGGDINLTGGDLLNDVNAGKGATVSAGDVNLIGGTASGTGDKTVPGSVSLTGGSSNQTDGLGGDISIMGGLALIGDGSGGNVGIAAADAAFLSNGIGGSVTMYAGQGYTMLGGTIDIRSGDATTGTAGNVQLAAGRAGPGGGIAGNIEFWGGRTLSAATTPSKVFVYSAGNKLSHSNGDFDNNHLAFVDAGDALANQYISRNFTTDATTTELFLDGFPYAGPTPPAGYSRRMVLNDNSSWRFEIHLVARRTDAANETSAYEIKGAIDRQVGVATTAIVGVVTYIITADDSGGAWTILVDADTTNGALRIQVTGQVAKTIRWVAFIRTVEVMN